MKFVVDSSVAAKFVLPEIDSDKAIQLRDEFLTGMHDLIAPDIFPAELAHTLTRAERQNRITPGEAERLWQAVMIIGIVQVPYFPLSLRALQRSSSVKMGFYDCVYLVVAERENCKFITADDKIIKNLGSRFPFITAFSELT